MRWTITLLAGSLLAACAQPEKPAATEAATPTSGGDCAELAKLALPDTTITTADLVSAGAFRPAPQTPAAAFSSLPEFCRVAAQLKPTPDSDIRFEVWLPANGWNGKFMGTGNGGAAGSIILAAMADPLKRGYAVANTDTGHTGGAGDYSWAAGHPEKLIDHAWRAVHLMTARSKDIVKAYYSAPPKRSYWLGCSTGGRQGLKEVQKFPADYDGVIAGAPAANWDALNTHSVLAQRELTDPNGLPASKLGVLKEAAIAACDGADGVRDRVINDPRACRFDPVVAQCSGADAPTCLTPNQVAAARRLYAGVIDPSGKTAYPGTPPTSEGNWAAFAGPGFRIGESYYANVVKADPKWSAKDFKYADLLAAQKLDNGLMTAMNPNISAFTGRGGKLILWHGWSDGLITPHNTINYYDSVIAKLGGSTAIRNVRLFMAPGVGHCSGGDGPGNVDWIAALERWVEQGEAPASVIASSSTKTRPLCAYPLTAEYKGSGSTDDAANFSCARP